MSASGKTAQPRARLAAVQALYQMELAGMGAEEVAEEFIDHRFEELPTQPDEDFFTAMVEGVPVHQVRDRHRHRRMPVGELDPGAGRFHPARHPARRRLSN